MHYWPVYRCWIEGQREEWAESVKATCAEAAAEEFAESYFNDADVILTTPSKIFVRSETGEFAVFTATPSYSVSVYIKEVAP